MIATVQAGAWRVPAVGDAPGLHANIGGPMSRTRVERISATLLGKDGGRIRCPSIIRLGLRFADGEDAVAVLESLIAEEGYGSPEDLREDFPIPEGRLICRPLNDAAARIEVGPGAARRAILEQALMLGLCSAQFFDPSRPVLWTQTSLTRSLELFDPAGFYA